VTDTGGNPSQGVTVSFAVTAGGGSVAPASAPTDVSGIATASSWTLGPGAGTNNNTVEATAAGLSGSPVVFTASGTGPPATQLSITTEPSGTAPSGAAFAQQPVIQLRDAGNNPVSQAGVVVTAAIASGGEALGGTTTATTDANGVASFTDLSISGTIGSRTLSFSAPSLTGATSASIDITAGPAAKLSISSGPSTGTSGGTLSPAFVIQLQDAAGNPVIGPSASVTVTIASGPGGGAISGTVSANTDPTGAATFSGIVLTGAGSYTLQFSAGGLTDVISGSITVT
jgi:hypothetical protein